MSFNIVEVNEAISRLRKEVPTMAQVDGIEPESSSEAKKLMEKHELEINRWKDYDRKIHEWKNQVIEIIRRLRKESHERVFMKNEIDKLKNDLDKKDQEIRGLQKIIELKNKQILDDQIVRSPLE
jgi:phosphotransferase system IIB component